MSIVTSPNGYSLLVVIIALVIFSTGILSIITLLPSGHRSVKETIFRSRSATIAEKELASIRSRYSGQDSPEPPERISGTEPDGLRWTAEIKKTKEMYVVTLNIYRRENGQEEQETFETRFVKK